MVNRRVVLYVLVSVAAAARLLLQVAALPPYAGLDEVWHVSRLAFVHAEGRNPNIRENSVPRYIASATANDPAFPADFGHIGARWPEVVRARDVLVDHAVEVRPYIRPNIEAQQPRLYYSVVGRVLPPHLSQLGELRFWRLLSIVFGVIIALATARIGETFFGGRGIVAGALLVSLPTWETLVARASNDGFACMWLAVALACTFAEANVIAEAVCWALAVATKLYTWPAMIVLLLRRRWSALGACAVSAAITVFDLATRTRNPFGVLGFDPAAQTGAPQPIRYLEMIKITLASAVWTSGQHWDALTVWGMVMYGVPIVALLMWGVRGLAVSGSRGDRETARLRDLATTFLAFAIAQVVHAAGYIRRARAMGLALPAAGKEGWFWYALAPLVVGMLFPAAPLALLAVWLAGWDVIITEGALFHDFAGVTSPAHPTWLFRWGPWHAPFTADLTRVAVGPLASHLGALRAVYLAAVAALMIVTYNGRDR
jgi:hypothetical protein